MNSVAVVVTALVALAALGQDAKPHLSNTALSNDQVAVYKAFLDSYNNGSKSTLNLSDQTEPLDFSELKSGSGCLMGIKVSQHDGQEIHKFGSELQGLKGIQLVDPEEQQKRVHENDPSVTIRDGRIVKDAVDAAFAAGLLRVSEVVFDVSGRYAVMSFSFFCGRLCGHGGTLVFEKTKSGGWKELNRECSSWIS